MAENELPSILNYWRNCLADAARMNVNSERFKEAFKIPKPEVEAGRINSAQVEEIFAAYLKSKKHGEQQQKVSLKEEDNLPIKVLVCPVAAFPKPVSTIKVAGKDKPITPIWIPAALFKDGILCPANEDKPWIPRNLLEPIELSGDTIGDVEAVDKFLALNSSPVNKEDKGQAPRWADVWRYSDELLNSVAQRTIKGFDIDGYIVANCSYVLLDLQDEKRIPAYHIIRLYEHILWDLENNKAFTAPRLLQRYANLHDEPLTPLLSPRAEVEKSSEHLGQMSRQDSKGREIFLSKSQREAMHHTLTMKDGEILAINGPPGTGKTTLLQSVVATLWVEAAAHGKGEPPIIVAASTNNQAVTNVIDSFGKVTEDESKLSGRWIPDLTSYGLYCPSISKQATATGFQITDQQKGGFCLALTPEQARDKAERRNIETEEFVDSAESYFLERCGEYAERRIDDVDAATKLLHERLIEVVDAIKRGPQIWLNLKRLADEMSSLYDDAGGVETCIHKRTEHLKEIRAKSRRLEETQHGWLEHANAAPFWMSLLSFIPQIKQRIAVRNKLYFSSVGLEADVEMSSAEKILDFFESKEDELKREERIAITDLESAERDKANFENAQREWSWWRAKHDLNYEPPQLLNRMDATLRHTAFKLATHYWEARWLLEMKEQIATQYEEKQSEEKQKKRWRRYAKLTPCVVATLHMLPAFFNAYNWRGTTDAQRYLPLYDYIDLLIIDEAGQVAPDIAGATFSLAKRSLVVGDTLQLKPVWGVTKHIDLGNLKKHQVVTADVTVDAICDAGLGASDGNVMKIAQRASKYQKSDERGKFERGMFLAEHRRCVPEIIEYCNRLAYKGRLIAARPSETGYPLPRLGYAHISGESTKEGGGSRVNAIEADVIAQWIAEHQEMLKSKLYPNLPLKEIIAVVTPFKRQTRLLKEKLADQGVTDDIDVGTVHVLQGAERHIILFSPVYGANDSPPYFFDDGVNMLNVAVSRAKDSFLVFGDMNSFNTNATEPSGILGRFLFADESNEITDVKLPVREKAPLSRNHPHLDTLEAHRTALTESIRNARRAVWIVSPFIAEAAIVADKLPAIIREAVNRGVKVTVYTDQKLNLNRDGSAKYSFTKGERILLNSGAIVKHVRSDHSKTLMMDHVLLIEGSFNWLSASRDPQSDYQRRERSLQYSGKDVESIIEKIIEETESRVIVRGTMYT
jgi:energy-coupling factor transporter ATP-binding protein EcfA2